MKFSATLFNIAILISGAFGFVSKFKLSRPTIVMNYLCDDEWNSGEVSWEFAASTQYTSGFTCEPELTQYQKKNIGLLAPVTLKSSITTPLYKTIQDDQIKMASTSAIVKKSYKEFINLDTLVYHIYNIINSHFAVFTLSELATFTFLTGIVFIYDKTKVEEAKRIDKLYKFGSTSLYFEKYQKIRKIITSVFIVFTVILTKNVQDAE